MMMKQQEGMHNYHTVQNYHIFKNNWQGKFSGPGKHLNSSASGPFHASDRLPPSYQEKQSRVTQETPSWVTWSTPSIPEHSPEWPEQHPPALNSHGWREFHPPALNPSHGWLHPPAP